jgi:coenzyme F420-reducing hydrogenase delta subunit
VSFCATGYRYNIDDVVRVDGFFNKTPVIEFVQKGLNAVSVSGEKVYEAHINESINAANDRLKLAIKFFSASVEMDEPPRYIFLVEFSDNPPSDKKKELLKFVEQELCERNLEYDDTRQRKELDSPVLKVVRKGEFEKYRSKRVAQGAHETQFKVPELVRDLDFQKNFDITEEIFLD